MIEHVYIGKPGRLIMTGEETRPGRAYNRKLWSWRMEDPAIDPNTYGTFKNVFYALEHASATLKISMKDADWQIVPAETYQHNVREK